MSLEEHCGSLGQWAPVFSLHKTASRTARAGTGVRPGRPSGRCSSGTWSRIRSHGSSLKRSNVSIYKCSHVVNNLEIRFLSGYPNLTVPWKLSLTGRILMIADCYDAMTSSRVYRREPLTPAKVLKLMFAKSGTSFDPTLLKLFVNCVGIVPIGSLVMLDSNELAVVLQPAQDKENAERPYVKVVADPAGEPIEDGPEYDLTEKNEAGEYTHSIVRLVDNAEYKFDTSRYFV